MIISDYHTVGEELFLLAETLTLLQNSIAICQHPTPSAWKLETLEISVVRESWNSSSFHSGVIFTIHGSFCDKLHFWIIKIIIH